MLPDVIHEDCVDEWSLFVNDDEIREEWSYENETWKPIDFYLYHMI